MKYLLSSLVVLLVMTSCSDGTPTRPTVPPTVVFASPSATARTELAPTGTLRVAVNYGNGANARRDSSSGELRGVAVELSRPLADALALPLRLIGYPSGPLAFDDFRRGAWDIYFSDSQPPGQPELTDDAPPHIQVENTYVVATSSPFLAVADVDRPGVRVGVAAGTNPDKYLTSEQPLKAAQLIRAPSGEEALALLTGGRVDALATGRNVMVPAGFRALNETLFLASLAVAMPKGRSAGLEYLTRFLDDAKRTGLIERAIAQAGLVGVRPASP
jgi:polar amino acid transport system substrate-binding protein